MTSNKKLIIIILLGIVIIGIGLLISYISRPKQIVPPISDKSNKSGVIISTDKTECNKGEIIKIVVNNKLNTPILYYSGGGRFWGIEYFKDDKWTDPSYKEGGGFQLTEEKIGDTCNIAFYERMPPTELKSESSLSSQWSQKICPFGTTGPAEPRIVRYIESGQYRLTFIYGFEISSEDPYKIKDQKTIYSNEFTIKEKKGIACFQLNEQQCRNQPSCIPLGGAITTYFAEGEVETFSFEECVDKVPEYKNCKEVVKMTQMRGGSQYSKECRCCCGEGPFCKEERPYPEK